MKKLISFLLIFALTSRIQAEDVEQKKSSWMPTQVTLIKYAVPVAAMIIGGVVIYYGYTINHNGNEILGSLNEGSSDTATVIMQAADDGATLMYTSLFVEGASCTLLAKQAWEDYTKDSSDEEEETA